MNRFKLAGTLAAAVAISSWIGPSPTTEAQGPRRDQPLFSGDAYTEYAMLAPGTNQFRITFLPFETEAGSKILINGTRSGSEGSDIEVYDPRTGKPIRFDYMYGRELKADNTPGRFSDNEHYIRAHLPFPVPQGGEGRVLILKTYKDARTYFSEGEDVIFKRTLGNGRQGIVLPKGHALVASNVSAQLITLADGRLKLAFADPNGYTADVTVRARKTTAAYMANGIVERGWQDDKTLYDLQAPETHSFMVKSDYSDYRKGAKARLDITGYLNLADLQVIDLDTAKPLKTAKDGALMAAELEVPITADKQSAHLRVTGRVQDPAYRVDNGDLVFERTVRGVRNTIWLPAGWEVSGANVPSTVGINGGRHFVQIVNGRPDDALKVLIRGRKIS